MKDEGLPWRWGKRVKTLKVSTVLSNQSIFFQSLHDLKKYTGSKKIKLAHSKPSIHSVSLLINSHHGTHFGERDEYGKHRSTPMDCDDIRNQIRELIVAGFLFSGQQNEPMLTTWTSTITLEVYTSFCLYQSDPVACALRFVADISISSCCVCPKIYCWYIRIHDGS